MKVHLMPLLEKIAFEKREKLLKSHFDFPIFLPLNERIKISEFFCLMLCGFWVKAAWKFHPDPIEIGKINFQLQMQFICYMELWRQILVIIAIVLVDIFQKISISEDHFASQTKTIVCQAKYTLPLTFTNTSLSI